MNDMVPDASSFLADMPVLEDVAPEAAAAKVPPAGQAAPDMTADMIPDATAFLMEGFAASGDACSGETGAERTGEPPAPSSDTAFVMPADAAGGVVLLPPSVALGSFHADPRAVLTGGRDAGRRGALSARLGFHVGSLRFVVPFEGASELSEMVAVYRLPNVPPWFRGLANLHGNLVPVFDVAAMIGFRVENHKDRMLLVLGHGATAAGMLVNELPTRIHLESATAVDLPELPDALKDCVAKAYLHGQEVWLELQYQRFFEMTAARLAS